jgi:hypothetical protein
VFAGAEAGRDHRERLAIGEACSNCGVEKRCGEAVVAAETGAAELPEPQCCAVEGAVACPDTGVTELASSRSGAAAR